MDALMIHPVGSDWRPARRSGVHCTQCKRVFAIPAPEMDANGQRICRDCREINELAEKMRNEREKSERLF